MIKRKKYYKSRKISNNLNKIKCSMIKSTNTEKQFSYFRDQIPVKNIKGFIEWILSSNYLSGKIIGNKFPQSNSEWMNRFVPSKIDFEKEIIWCLEILKFTLII